MAKIIEQSSSDPADLKVTLEVNKDFYSFYVKRSAIETMDRKDVVEALKTYLECAAGCATKASLGACIARCLLDGQCCDGGIDNCS